MRSQSIPPGTPTPLWIRYFAQQKTTQVPAATAPLGVLVDQVMCRDRAELIDSLVNAASRQVVVIDGHGHRGLSGVGIYGSTRTPLVQVNDLIHEVGPLPNCKVLILGGCYQGIRYKSWRKFAPAAIVVGAADLVYDTLGSQQVAQALKLIAERGPGISAVSVGQAIGTRYGFRARPALG